MSEIVLPIKYSDVSRECALKGEAYAEQVIKGGYDAGSRDALATLSAIVFEQQKRLERLRRVSAAYRHMQRY